MPTNAPPCPLPPPQALLHAPLLRNHYLLNRHSRVACPISADGGFCINCELASLSSFPLFEASAASDWAAHSPGGLQLDRLCASACMPPSWPCSSPPFAGACTELWGFEVGLEPAVAFLRRPAALRCRGHSRQGRTSACTAALLAAARVLPWPSASTASPQPACFPTTCLLPYNLPAVLQPSGVPHPGPAGWRVQCCLQRAPRRLLPSAVPPLLVDAGRWAAAGSLGMQCTLCCPVGKGVWAPNGG